MIEEPIILSLFDITSTRKAWEPMLTQFPGCIITLEKSDNLSECLEEGIRDIAPQLLVISSNLFSSRGKEIIEYLRKKYPDLNVVVLNSEELPRIPLWSLIINNVRHLAVADPLKESDKCHALFRAFAANKPWEISFYLQDNFVFHEYQLFDPMGKEAIIGKLEDIIVGSTPDLEILRQKGALLADEMIENALDAAPSGAIAKMGIVINVGFDGETLAIQVKDTWGSLTPEKAIEHLARHQDCRTSLDHVRGRGLFILWQFFDHFHVNIKSGKETTIGGQLKLKSTQMPGQSKGFDFLHMFSSTRTYSPHLTISAEGHANA
jgi:anti-sigma regulatory factor (Ser/Thr protein kinase)